ncbi:MAG TPA: RNA-binding protein [Chloroflexia bacterium]|nr:RNA-binding protein [Chloroflexia bacterium]
MINAKKTSIARSNPCLEFSFLPALVSLLLFLSSYETVRDCFEIPQVVCRAYEKGVLMAKKLYITGLAANTSSENLRYLFTLTGQVNAAWMIVKGETDSDKGFGYVEMNSDSEADQALKALDGIEFFGHTLKVSLIPPPQESELSL